MTFFSCALIGTSPNGDVFHSGFSVNSGVGGEASAQALADKIASKFDDNYDKTFTTSTFSSLWATSLKWDKAAVYERPMTATGASIEVAEATLGPSPGTGSGVPLPPETAVCVSLLTGAPGRSARGRMYLPAPVAHTFVLGSTGGLTPSARNVIRDWAAAFFGGINTGALGDTHVVVWSRKHASVRDVTQVSVGDQFDVQRRRQNSAPEGYATAAVSQF